MGQGQTLQLIPGNQIKKYRGRSHLQSEIDSKIVLAPRFGTITKADPLEVDPTVK
jgi:hypothetical protein